LLTLRSVCCRQHVTLCFCSFVLCTELTVLQELRVCPLWFANGAIKQESKCTRTLHSLLCGRDVAVR